MKILLATQHSAVAHPLPAYRFWPRYFQRGLEEAGHTVAAVPGVDWARGLLPQPEAEHRAWRAQAWEATLAAVRAAPPDVFLGYFFPSQIDMGAVAEIRRAGVPCVLFFCDNIREFTVLPAEFAAFDLHWVPEVRARPMYAARSWRHVYAPMPAWVPAALRQPPAVERHPPTFLGSRDGLRAALLDDALAAGAELEIGGAGWTAESNPPPPPAPPAGPLLKLRRQLDLVRRDGWLAPWHKLGYRFAERRPTPHLASRIRARPPENDEFLAVLRESEVAIGINRYPSFRHPFARPDTYSRLRDLEAPMAGACYLTEWTPDLPQLYDVERDIATYRTGAELAARLRELRAAPARRREMRERAQRRALGEHTVGASFARITRELGLTS